LVFEVADGVTTPKESRELISKDAKLLSLSPSYSIRHAFYFNLIKKRLVFKVTDGVTTPEESRELVSKAAELMSLSPSYSIRHAIYFNLIKKRLVFEVTNEVAISEALDFFFISESCFGRTQPSLYWV